MAFYGGEAAVPASATSIASLLSITDSGRKHYKTILLRNATGAANPAFVGPSTVTTSANRAAVLAATDTNPTSLIGGPAESLNIDQIFIIGTVNAANIVHITLIN
jgi:hypothetical protein